MHDSQAACQVTAFARDSRGDGHAYAWQLLGTSHGSTLRPLAIEVPAQPSSLFTPFACILCILDKVSASGRNAGGHHLHPSPLVPSPLLPCPPLPFTPFFLAAVSCHGTAAHHNLQCSSQFKYADCGWRWQDMRLLQRKGGVGLDGCNACDQRLQNASTQSGPHASAKFCICSACR